MLLAILGAAIGLLESRSSLLVWEGHLCFQVAVFAILITLLFARPGWPEIRLFGGACTFRLVVLPLGVSGFAPMLRWFAQPDKVNTEPYYELPLLVTKFRSSFHFRLGTHSLPIEQGRIGMLQVPRHLRRCTIYATNVIGDKRPCVSGCPHFQGLWQQYAEIFANLHDAMRSLMWHKEQESICALVLATHFTVSCLQSGCM